MAAFIGILPYGKVLTNKVTKKTLCNTLDRVKTDILLGNIKAKEVTINWFENEQDWDKFLAWKI
jgi:hypothetical protein